MPTTRSALRVGLLTAGVLLIPAVGMLLSDSVDWGVFDFVYAGALVAGVGLVIVATPALAARTAQRSG